MFEKPRDVIRGEFANHAHNDFLEVWLEAGIPGAALFGLFLIWLMLGVRRAWRARQVGGFLDLLLARAATIAIVLLLLHSLVDYPLRTAAMQCLFALSCALLLPAPGANGLEDEEAARRHGASGQPRRSRSATTARSVGDRDGAVAWPDAPFRQSVPRHKPAPPSKQPVRGEPWGSDVVWPEAWRPSMEPKTTSRPGLQGDDAKSQPGKDDRFDPNDKGAA